MWHSGSSHFNIPAEGPEDLDRLLWGSGVVSEQTGNPERREGARVELELSALHRAEVCVF